MPIRTNRGRAAVYRKLWSWPMRSPRHLTVTALVFLSVILTVGLLIPRLTGSHDSSDGATATVDSQSSSASPVQSYGRAPGPGSPPPSSAASPLPTRITAPPQTPTPAPADAKALEVAGLWAKAWVNHPAGVSNEQWRQGLRDYTTDEQFAVMSTVDPSNIPATKVTGEPVAITSYTTSVEAKVVTDGGALSITVIATPQGWRVNQYDLAV